MRHIDLFSGIGGFALAASWVWPDHDLVAFCEKDEFCRRVLKKHWPQVPIIDDVRDFNGADYANVDLLTGGFPCQPFSSAGKRGGTEDDRYLWPEMLRAIREARPRYVLAENVPGLLSHDRWLVFEQVLSDLEDAGYEVAPLVIPACSVDAPHRRDRVWIVAYAEQREGGERYDAELFGRWSPSPEQARMGRADVAGAASNGMEGSTRQDWQPKRCRPGEGGVDSQRDSEAMGNADLTPAHAHAKAGGPRGATSESGGWQLESRVCGVAHGPAPWLDEPGDVPRVATDIPDRIHRLRALGNAIVPQVAAQIFLAIKASDEVEAQERGEQQLSNRIVET